MRMFNGASVLDRGLVNQHDRDVILHRIDAPARVALQPRAVVDQVHGGLAGWAHQDFKERGVNRHLVNIGQFKTMKQSLWLLP